jgi:hypothetical protein
VQPLEQEIGARRTHRSLRPFVGPPLAARGCTTNLAP